MSEINNQPVPPEFVFKSEVDSPIAFVFLHGLSNSTYDLYHFAQEINKEGFYCELLQIPAHDEHYGADHPDANLDSWQQILKRKITSVKKKYTDVYVVGFSIGATMALILSGDKELGLKGIVCISTFIDPAKKLQFKLAQYIAKVKKTGVHRGRPNVTKKSSLHNIWWFKRMPLPYLTTSYKAGVLAKKEIVNNNCPVLFLHSTADEVADYHALEKLILIHGNEDMKLITFVELKHFLHLDLNPSEFWKVVKIYFKIDKHHNRQVCYPRDELIAQFEKITDETNQWASYCYHLVIGFFSIMGALLYFTLPDVFNNDVKTPYYLLSYCIIIHIYIQIFSLYYFFNMRADVYRKNYIEPLFKGVSWIEYRTNRWLSSWVSEKYTDLVVFSTIALPIISSAIILIYFFTEYYLFCADLSIQIISLVSIVTLGLSIRSLFLTNQYTSQNLYSNSEKIENVNLLTSIFRLKQTANPGKVFKRKTIE